MVGHGAITNTPVTRAAARQAFGLDRPISSTDARPDPRALLDGSDGQRARLPGSTTLDLPRGPRRDELWADDPGTLVPDGNRQFLRTTDADLAAEALFTHEIMRVSGEGQAPRPAPERRVAQREVPPSPVVAALLARAFEYGASTMHLVAGSRPAVRRGAELVPLSSTGPLGAPELESLLVQSMPDSARQAFREGRRVEWTNVVPRVGHVTSVAFHDRRGPVGRFRLAASRALTVDHLQLSAEIQALALEPSGLVLVAGLRFSGRSAVIDAFVDLMSRVRQDHIITLESDPSVVHDPHESIVSQRPVGGGPHRVLRAARTALRDDPDVLVVHDLRGAAVIRLALESAAAGHLVIGGVAARTATETLARIINAFPPAGQRNAERLLSDTLRGVVAQTSLRRRGGGREFARDVLLNTRAVGALIAQGRISELPLAIEAGRHLGMESLNNRLAVLVRTGAVDLQEACRHADDRAAFLALLKRQGVDGPALDALE
jgi:twitching motility protein PilT